jgi:hypothetical protein
LILSGQKKYWTASREMEEAIHNFVCLESTANNKDRKTASREMHNK